MKTLVQDFVGKKATALLGGLQVEVEILDVKVAYGRPLYHITPVAGSGEVWIEKVTLI